jgi:hypothetical protein
MTSVVLPELKDFHKRVDLITHYVVLGRPFDWWHDCSYSSKRKIESEGLKNAIENSIMMHVDKEVKFIDGVLDTILDVKSDT